jgi:hypothetical protein
VNQSANLSFIVVESADNLQAERIEAPMAE